MWFLTRFISTGKPLYFLAMGVLFIVACGSAEEATPIPAPATAPAAAAPTAAPAAAAPTAAPAAAAPTAAPAAAAPVPTKVPTITPKEERGGVLLLGATATDVPYTGGGPSQGFEGFRMTGYTLYDALHLWDLAQDEYLPGVLPGLAVSWEVNPNDFTKYTYQLRRGVKFHDGSDWNADALIFNLHRLLDENHEGFMRTAARNQRQRLQFVKPLGWEKVDDYTVKIETTRPTTLLPEGLVYVFHASPSEVLRLGEEGFAETPSGSGPFKMKGWTALERLDLEPNFNYWDPDRVPKLDQFTMLVMPEVTTRLAALQVGQVNWIEVPPYDALEILRRDGFQIVQGQYPYIWHSYVNMELPGWDNKLVRQAANYALDGEGMCQDLLLGACNPAVAEVWPGHDWFGDARQYTFDPAKARQLLLQAEQEGVSLPVKGLFVGFSAGGGLMLPAPMLELIQRDLNAVEGFEITIEALEYSSFVDRFFRGLGTRNPEMENVASAFTASNFQEPHSAFIRFFHSDSAPPNGSNRNFYSNPEIDRLIEEAEITTDTTKRDRLLGKVHELMVEDAPWIFVAHDLNPRAMSPEVRGFVQPQSWFFDLTTVWVSD